MIGGASGAIPGTTPHPNPGAWRLAAERAREGSRERGLPASAPEPPFYVIPPFVVAARRRLGHGRQILRAHHDHVTIGLDGAVALSDPDHGHLPRDRATGYGLRLVERLADRLIVEPGSAVVTVEVRSR